MKKAKSVDQQQKLCFFRKLAILYGMSASTAGKRMGKTAKEGQELMDNFFKKFPKVKQLIEDSRLQLKNTGFVEDWAGRRRHLPDYFLAPYEVEYKDSKKQLAATFNPFINCENRTYIDDKLKKYLVQANKSRSNKEYEGLAAEASKEGISLTANTGRIAQAERQCLNARIQGGAASLTKLAMVNIENDPELNKLLAKLIITVHDEVLVECPAYYADKVEERLPQIMIDTAKPYISTPMSCDPYNVDRWYGDVAGEHLRDEFKKIKTKNPNWSKEQILDILIKNHPEYSATGIEKTVSADIDIEL